MKLLIQNEPLIYNIMMIGSCLTCPDHKWFIENNVICTEVEGRMMTFYVNLIGHNAPYCIIAFNISWWIGNYF